MGDLIKYKIMKQLNKKGKESIRMNPIPENEWLYYNILKQLLLGQITWWSFAEKNVGGRNVVPENSGRIRAT
jgi:hypothetical protein